MKRKLNTQEIETMEPIGTSLSDNDKPRYTMLKEFEFKCYKFKKYYAQEYFTNTKQIVKCKHFDNLSWILNDLKSIEQEPQMGSTTVENGGWGFKEMLEMLPAVDIKKSTLESKLELLEIFNIHYTNDVERIVEIQGIKYLVPCSEFIISNYHVWLRHLIDLYPKITINSPKYDLILMDPPWKNSSGSKKYDTLDCYELLKLPLKRMLSDDGYIAVWVTNNTKYQKFLVDWFKRMKMHYKELVWFKLASNQKPVIPLGNPRRLSYEILIIGKMSEFCLEYDYVVGEVQEHSRKPNVNFEQVLGCRLGRKMEMFARVCRDGYLCWGNETLKFNHLDYLQDNI